MNDLHGLDRWLTTPPPEVDEGLSESPCVEEEALWAEAADVGQLFELLDTRGLRWVLREIACWVERGK